MASIASLWLPILLSAVAVFFVSFAVHMVLPYHKNDFAGVPDEPAARAAIGALKLPPGDYHLPRPASSADWKSPEFAAKMQEGPVVMLTVMRNGPVQMGPMLAQWFAYSLLVGVFAAYVASRALLPGAVYLDVFRFVGVTAYAGYSLALIHDSIWYARKWSTTVKYLFDGLLYAAVTAGIFGWLYPY